MEEHQIFISYTTRNELIADFIRVLLGSLNKQNLSPWIYESPKGQIEIGANISNTCLKKIDECCMFIALVSDETFQSTYTKMEVEYFLNNRNSRILVPIIFTSNKAWEYPYSEIVGIKGYSKLSKELETLNFMLYVEKIVQDICIKLDVDYIPNTTDNPRLPLSYNIVQELKGSPSARKDFKANDIHLIISFCNKLEEAYQKKNYELSKKILWTIEQNLEISFPNEEFYYIKIVQGILETEMAIEQYGYISPEENVFKNLIDSQHPKLDENAYAGLAYIELFYGDVHNALKNYEIAQEFIDETDVALLHNILLAKIASNKEIEGKYVKQLEEYISKGVTSQTQGSIDRLYMLYLLYLSYTDNVNEAINLSKNYHYDFDESSDILMYMLETILTLAEKRPMYGDEYLDKALSLIDFILNFEEKLSSDFIFYLYSKEAWIYYDKGKNYLNQAIDYLEILKEKYPNSIVVLRDLTIMMIENNNEKRGYEYCLEIQNFKNNLNILPSVSVDEFEYILGFSFWAIGEIEKADECFRRTSYDESQRYAIVYDWLNVPILKSNKSLFGFF